MNRMVDLLDGLGQSDPSCLHLLDDPVRRDSTEAG